MKLFGLDLSKIASRFSRSTDRDSSENPGAPRVDLNTYLARLSPYATPLAYLAIGIAVGTYIVKTHTPEPPDSRLLDAQEQRIQSYRAQMSEIRDQPFYPSIWQTWTAVEAYFVQCGVTFDRAEPDDNGGGYRGPALHWTAQISGPSKTLLVCLLDTPATPLIRFGEITITSEQSNAYIEVLGRKVPGVQP